MCNNTEFLQVERRLAKYNPFGVNARLMFYLQEFCVNLILRSVFVTAAEGAVEVYDTLYLLEFV